MAYFATFLLVYLAHKSSALKTISDEEFATFMPLRHVDRFSHCVEAAGGAYCTADFDLVANGPNEFYDKMLNYSYSARRHFDYTNGRYGYCITRRCKEFYKGDSESELMEAMGLCLNHTLEQEYGLQARIKFGMCYRKGEQKYPVTWLDYFAAALFLSLVGLAAAGTIYDLAITDKDKKGYLMCFSVTANWKKLKAPWPQDQMTARMAVFNGIRTITAVIVVIMHALIHAIAPTANPEYYEKMFESHSNLMSNAPVVMQSFFFMSGLFLMYTTQISNEKFPLTWRSLPKVIFLRWLRLSPVHHVMLLYTMTWFKFVPYGPFWQGMVDDEVQDCHQQWPSFIMYYNNYVFGQRCNIHHWSTAVDMHVHILGLLILVASPTEKFRDAILWILTIIGIILPGIETYRRDLDGAFIMGFKVAQDQRQYYQSPIFNYIYKRTHTNLAAFGIGMLYGLFLYKWMKKSVDTSKYKKYAFWYWMIFPIFIFLIYMNIFLVHMEGQEQAHIGIRVFYAIFQKAAWCISLVILTFGIICRIENVYRRILEWPSWVPLMKLTYCTYNVNMVVALWLYGANSQLSHSSDLHLITFSFGVVVLTFVFSTILWLLVEAPCNNLARKLFPEKQSILKVEESPKKTE